ncbi:MAG: SDR family NAD(P)-dependent oxidoreductase [Spirochaetales bacterium]|jgi:NAD(P)-dependent dehydrogenase (short-subunit alcohol dehydrogenase family)|nr:SDR family NAD(P)-dependent oxidoreductase [Spirochaetales bacterium]
MGNILLAGTGGAFLSELTEEVLAAGSRVAVTADTALSARESVDKDRKKTNLYYIAWNPRSPLSARTLVTEAWNDLEAVDEVIVSFFADTGKKEFHDMAFADMEKVVDDSIKSYFFLVKEIFIALRGQKKGVLSFAYHDGGVEVLPPLQAAAAAAFRAFASSLFAQYQNEPFTLYGYYSSLAETRAFARFLSRLADTRTEKTARRWVRFSGKSGLFSFGRNKQGKDS